MDKVCLLTDRQTDNICKAILYPSSSKGGGHKNTILTPSSSFAETVRIQVPRAVVSLIVTRYGDCVNTGEFSFLVTVIMTVSSAI